MTLYICNDCGAIFDEPREIKECMGEFWGAPAYDTTACCPACGADDYEEFDDDEEEEEPEEQEEEEPE